MKTSLSRTVIVLLSISFVFAQSADNSRLVYKWYAPDQQGSFPALLIIGGSEGGLGSGEKWAQLLNEKGYGVMDLAYFGSPGLPSQLEEIPIEYFQKALDTLQSFRGVRKNALGIISVSKGTEAAFLLASQNKAIRLVIAASPSHVVWQSVNPANYNSNKSSWTQSGIPLPFLSYDYSRGYYPLINFYLGTLEKPYDDKAIIPVENSTAEIVLLSGGRDQFWPSTLMANSIVSRMHSKKNSSVIIHQDFKEAGHGFLIPYQNEDEKKKILTRMGKMIQHFGGTIEAFDEAMTESLQLVLKEIQLLQSLKK